MLCNFVIVIACFHLGYAAISNDKQIDHQSHNVDTTNPTLSIVGLGPRNVTFTWTKTGVWKDEGDFTVILLSRIGDYRPIDINASFTQFKDILDNVTYHQPNYFCNEDSCLCRFGGHLGPYGDYYKGCSDGVVVVQAGGLSLSANFTTAPSTKLGVSSQLDGNNLIVQWRGFNNSDDGVCGRHILLNIYQPVENDGFTPQGWYWPGSDYYGNVLHQLNLSADTKWETEYNFPLDPELATDDVRTHSVAAVVAYLDGDLVTNNWEIGRQYYDGNSQAPGASISAFIIVLASLLSLTFNL